MFLYDGQQFALEIIRRYTRSVFSIARREDRSFRILRIFPPFGNRIGGNREGKKKRRKIKYFFIEAGGEEEEEEGLLRGKSVARSAANPASAKRYRIFASFCGSGKKGGKICARCRKKKKGKKNSRDSRSEETLSPPGRAGAEMDEKPRSDVQQKLRVVAGRQ